MRKLSKTLAIMGLLTPVGANALGVGEIKLHSALNQNLKANIPLITSGSESTSAVRVNLASPSAFAKAGLERPFYLSGLRFKTVNKGGRVTIQVTSRDIIREPFLNFLVEVNWPQGRMLREFTVLLDPPVMAKKKSVTAHSAPLIKSTTVTQPAYRVDAPSNYGFRARPVTSANKPNSQYKAGDSITVRKNDTLWGIAKRVNRDASVSDEQMLVALYELNPRAFFKKNMNALKAGARLKIPEHDTIVANSAAKVTAEIRDQYKSWVGQVGKPSEKNSQNTLKDHESDAPKLAAESKLKLVAPSDKDSTIGENVGSAAGNKSDKAELAMEMAETVSQENEELRSRLRQIEVQLAMMQKLITLKDKQLSTLQAKQSGVTNTAAGEKIIDIEGVDQSAVSTVDKLLTDPMVQASPVDTVVPTESDSTNVEPKTQRIDTKMDSAGNPIPVAVEPDVQPVNQVAEKDVAPASKPASKQTNPMVKEDDLLSEIFSEPLYLAAGGGGIVVLGLLAWMFVRRRQAMDQIGAESLLDVPSSEQDAVDDVKTNEFGNGGPADVSMVAESSFLSEFTPSDFDALETEHDEVDPVSEADVYLAYGRYQQAEDLIRSAIENYPDRDECKLKLFEIHYATEDKAAFEAYAEELAGMKNDNPDFWSKVVEMGREICPQNSLFGGTPSVSDETGVSEELPEILVTQSSLDHLVETQILEESSNPVNHQDDNAIEQQDEPGVDQVDLGLDMGLDSFTLDADQPVDDGVDFDANAVVMGGVDDVVSLEIDATLPASDVMEGLNSEAADEQTDNNDIEFEGGGLEFSMEEEATQTSTESGDGGDDGLDFELNFSSSSMESDTDNEGDSISDFTDSDEIETKLDLAKAYVEMDDQESAKDILTEILAEGSDEQKTEAQALVDVMENKA